MSVWLSFLPCVELRAISLDERFQLLEEQEQIEAQELRSRIGVLIERLDADDRDTRRRAVAELEFYADDPRVVERLLAMLAADDGRPALSSVGQINAMHVLLQTTPEAWTASLLERADAVLDVLAERDLPSAGPQRRRSVERLADHVRGVEAARAPSVAYGVVQERTAKTEALTDVDVFVCDAAESLEPAYQLARRLAERDFGRVRLRELTPDVPLLSAAMEGHTTVLFDPKHPEADEVARTEAAVAEVEGLPPFQAEPNRDAPTYWYLSVFVCP